MTATAPPRPPRPGDPMERAEIEALVEALIEEARERARRRRQRYLEAALLALLVGFALSAGFGGSDSAQRVASSAFAASGAPSAADPSSLSFDLLSTTASGPTTVVDRAPKGPSVGDTVQWKSVLRNRWAHQFGRPRNAVVGRDSWLWTTLPGGVLIKVKVWLPGGTLRLRRRAPASGGNPLVVPIVGGTGRFANVRGVGQFTRRIGNNPSYADYELRLP